MQSKSEYKVYTIELVVNIPNDLSRTNLLLQHPVDQQCPAFITVFCKLKGGRFADQELEGVL